MAERKDTVIVTSAVGFIASALTARLAQSWNLVGLDITAPKSVPPNATFGQNTLMPGARSGIGEGVARRFAVVSAAVGINHRSPSDSAARAVEEIRAGDGIAVQLKADVSDEKEVRSMFAAFVEAAGRIDILVATAEERSD